MSLSIDNTYFSPYTQDTVNTAADKLTDRLQGANTDEETLDACKQFEAYMIQQMYKNMQEAAKVLTDDDDDDSSSNQYVDMFSDNYLEAIANNMVYSGQGLGIAEQFYDSIQKNAGVTGATAAAATTADTE